MVFLVNPEMLGEIDDPICQEGDLNFGGTSVAFVNPVLFNYGFFSKRFLRQKIHLQIGSHKPPSQ